MPLHRFDLIAIGFALIWGASPATAQSLAVGLLEPAVIPESVCFRSCCFVDGKLVCGTPTGPPTGPQIMPSQDLRDTELRLQPLTEQIERLTEQIERLTEQFRAGAIGQ